jgi:hypothetical protein
MHPRILATPILKVFDRSRKYNIGASQGVQEDLYCGIKIFERN